MWHFYHWICEIDLIISMSACEVFRMKCAHVWLIIEIPRLMAIHLKSTNWNHSITFLSSTCLSFALANTNEKCNITSVSICFLSTAWGANNEAAFSISRMEKERKDLKWIKNQWKLNWIYPGGSSFSLLRWLSILLFSLRLLKGNQQHCLGHSL